MIKNYAHIKRFFESISKALDEKVTFYVIGGTVLLHQGFKPGTKDIDLIVETRKEFLTIQNALKKLGFKPQTPEKEYDRMNLSHIYQKDDMRADIFEKEVCGKFSLSDGMKRRAIEIHSFNNLNVMNCANEDIFLFKTMTEREGDLTDCISLATKELNWQEILKELKNQIQKSKQDVWITWVGERMDILQERGVIIPVMSEIDELRKKFFEDLEERFK